MLNSMTNKQTNTHRQKEKEREREMETGFPVCLKSTKDLYPRQREREREGE